MIHSDGNGNLHARPSVGVAFGVITDEPPHHVCIIRFDAYVIVIAIVKLESKAIRFKESRHIGV